jgi:hypothetical protein
MMCKISIECDLQFWQKFEGAMEGVYLNIIHKI